MKKVLIALLAVMIIVAAVGCAPAAAPAGDEPAADQPAAEEAAAEGASEEATEAGSASLEEVALAYFAEYPGSRIVEWADLFTLIDAGEEPYILSIRKTEDYEAGHIEGAVNMAWGADLASKFAMLPKDETVYVYCYSGQTAGQAIALMNMLGIDAVSVKSGFNKGAMTIEGYEDYVSTTAADVVDAGAEFDGTIQGYVEEYFNTVGDNGNNIIAAADAMTLIEAGEVTVVDIRKTEDYDAGHIEGAVSLPFGEGMDFSDLSMDDELIVTCYSGQTAGQTVAVMKALGYNAKSLKSGMKGWVSGVKATAANAYFSEYPGSRIVEWADLFAMMDAGDAPLIVSIRSADDYAAGHITTAVNMPWGPGLAEGVAQLAKGVPVYVYCYSGQTAGQAVALMNMLGIEAYSVKSGFNKGAMTVDGYEAYVDTTDNMLADAGETFDSFLLTEVQNYFNAIPDSGNNIMTVEDVQAAVDAGEVTVVDIRKAEDFAAGHVAGAVSVPFGANMQEGFADLPAGKLVVACYSGQTAGQTTAVLRMLGYDAVSMKFGMKLGWTEAGLPVE